mgnify:CR=1 FL=1
MSTLSKYISDLLFLHNCVIVPELGGFVAEFRSAVIDDQREMIYPPSKSLAFNNALRRNDGLLVNYIAHKRELTYEAAATWLSLALYTWMKTSIFNSEQMWNKTCWLMLTG